MPVFDTPINTDDNNLDRVLTQALPVLLYLYNRDHQQGANALNQTAGDHAGKLLVVKVNVVENPQTVARYNPVTLPAIFAIKDGAVQSSASGPEIEAVLGEHVAYLLGQGGKPATKTATTSVNGPIAVTDSTFQREVMQSEIPVLVDFWAPWCGPCHAIAPAVEQIARQYAGRAKVVKLNVDENPRTASQYQTMSIPTLIVFKGGRQLNRLVGAHPQISIENLVRSAL